MFFVFRRRDDDYIESQESLIAAFRMVRLLRVRAAEKQKENVNGMVSGYKQATPTGFGKLTREATLILGLKCRASGCSVEFCHSPVPKSGQKTFLRRRGDLTRPIPTRTLKYGQCY